jgi:hypothetical protein
VSDETTTVEFQVTGFERVRSGRVIGLAKVSVSIADVELELQGVRLVLGRAGGLTIEPPVFRHPGGKTWPAVILPAELANAIAQELLAIAVPCPERTA